MLKLRFSVLVSTGVTLLGLFGLSHHLHLLSSMRSPGGLYRDGRTELPSFHSFKVPGEIDGFTPHIWQTTGPRPISTQQANDLSSWRGKHPFFSFSLMTDEQGDSFVREHYSSRPDIVGLFLRLPIPIIKADLFRYLVLVAKGGIYADIDVSCEQPISTWLPQDHMNSTDSINLIIGLEFDIDFRGEGEEVVSQFTNWVIASKPGNKHLMHVIDTAVAGIYAIA